MTCLECEAILEKPSDRKKFCSRSCQGKFQGRKSNLSRVETPQWSEEEVDFLRLAYGVNTPIDIIASQLNRPIYGIYLKASRIGLGNCSREKTADHRSQISDRVKKWWTTLDKETIQRIVNHPCTEETKKKISRTLRKGYAEGRITVSEEQRQRAGDRLKVLQANDPRFGHPGRARAGKREDIGFYVRSSWEANYARYLIHLQKEGQIVKFEYEPERFEFHDIKRGTRSYLPDFRIEWIDGRVEYHEVKGYWTTRGKTAVKRFKARYPDKVLVIIDKPVYKQLEADYADILDNWEK